MTREEAGEPSPRDDNPYEPPLTAVSTPRPRPKVLPWVLAGAGIGAACGAAVELLGWARLTPADATGIGGAIVGGLAGALMGRMIGRLRVAQFSFQKAAQRRHELYDELQQRRQSAKAARKRDQQ